MSTTNGKRRPPRPQIELVSGSASDTEAAAIVAALEQFLADTAPTPDPGEAEQSPWQRAALEEGIAARQVSGHAWGPSPLPRCAVRDKSPASAQSGATPSKEERVAVVKIIELVGSSKTSTDDAAKQALSQAQSSIRNIRAVDIVSTGIRGDNLDEYRAHVRVAFVIEGTDVD